jgi:nucleotidyltransferase/DNA polymerase involved in DNA repair
LPTIDALLPDGGLLTGALHEIEAGPGPSGRVAPHDGAALGFAAHLARPSLQDRARSCGAAAPPAASTPRFTRPTLSPWFDPARLLMVTAHRDEDLFWAMEEGLRCPGIAAVLGETRAADPTAGRRLSLAAEKSGIPALLLRTQPAPPQSVCATRWRIASAPSHSTPGLSDVGAARWHLELRRNRFGTPSAAETPSWLVEWNDETHCLAVVPQALHGSPGAHWPESTKDWSDRAAATVVWHDGCPRLAAVNPHARAAGLRPRMRLADARALLPDLVTVAGEPQADRRLIEAIAGWCDRYTPWVAIDPLGGALAEEIETACSAGGFGGDAGLLLDVTGCTHLFGEGEAGERALLADLVTRLARRDLSCRAAMADTAGAAWALARFAERQADLFCPVRGQRDALGSLPVEGLRLDPPVLETFLKLGLRRIGDLYPMPRAPLARRFGEQPLNRLDQALGTLAEPIEPRRIPPAFRTRLAFAEPIGRPRTSPPRPAACWQPFAVSSNRRASARASSRSRSTASTDRSTAPRSAPAGPTATTRS